MPAIMPTDSPGGREGEGLAEAELLGKVEETQQHMGGGASCQGRRSAWFTEP